MKYLRCMLLGLLISVVAVPISNGKSTQYPEFTRSEIIILNLDRGQKSTGYYLLDSYKQVRESTRNLERALYQLEQADREYARSVGRSDDKFFASACQQIKQAKEEASQLTEHLLQAREELKSSIQQTLISRQSR